MTFDAVAAANNTSAVFCHLADSDSRPEHLRKAELADASPGQTVRAVTVAPAGDECKDHGKGDGQIFSG